MAKLFEIKKASSQIVHGGRIFDNKSHNFTAEIFSPEVCLVTIPIKPSYFECILYNVGIEIT